MKRTLEGYLRDAVRNRQTTEFALRARIEPDHHVTFCIHPATVSGETGDFEAYKNIVRQNRDTQRTDADEIWECPNCGRLVPVEFAICECGRGWYVSDSNRYR